LSLTKPEKYKFGKWSQLLNDKIMISVTHVQLFHVPFKKLR
jgi:hypothetical protein